MWKWIWAAICVGIGLILQSALHDQHPHPGQTMCGARKMGLVVVGDGGVSHGLLELLEGLNHSRIEVCGADIHIAAVGNARGFIKHSKGLTWNHVRAIQNHTVGGFELAVWEGLDDDQELQHKETLGDVVKDMAAFGHFDKYIVVDCSTNTDHLEDLILAKELGMGLVIANLPLVTGPWTQYARLVHGGKQQPSRLVALDAVVGKGLPVLTTIRQLQSTGDRINRIEGTFSDAVGHVFNEMERGSIWSDAVSTVYENGLTEDDPRDDLTGLTLARKAIVLARSMGRHVELANVHVESLLPPRMTNGTIQEFFHQLEELNEEMSEKWSLAKSKGEKLSYIATINDKEIRIGLESIGITHSLYPAAFVDSVADIRTSSFPHGIRLHLSKPDPSGTVISIMADIARLSCTQFSRCD